VNQLPEGWREVPIGELCDLINGRAFKPTDWTETGLPIVRIQNLNRHDAPFNRYDKPVKEKYYIDSGELLFAWSGTPGTSFGAHIWNGGRALLNQHIFRVIWDADQVDRDYFRFAINQKLNDLISVAHGGVGLRHVTKGTFEKTEVVVPPLETQHRIVAHLDAFHERTRAARAALEAIPPLVETFRQSVLAAAFRGDLTADWRAQHPDVEPASVLLERIRVERRERWIEDYTEKHRARAEKRAAKAGKPWTAADDQKHRAEGWNKGAAKYVEPEPVDAAAEGLPELPETWCWARLDEVVFEMANGRSVPTRTGGFPVLRLTALSPDGALNMAEHKPGDWDAEAAAQYIVKNGDFLVSRGNGSLRLVGIGAFATDTKQLVAYPDTMIRLRFTLQAGLEPGYISALWRSVIGRRQLESCAKTTAGIHKIGQGDLQRVLLPLAPAAEQTAVVHALATNRSAAGLGREAADASERSALLERSALAKAFRGELVP
jgi:type I restriction enzyme, S subunit